MYLCENEIMMRSGGPVPPDPLQVTSLSSVSYRVCIFMFVLFSADEFECGW